MLLKYIYIFFFILSSPIQKVWLQEQQYSCNASSDDNNKKSAQAISSLHNTFFFYAQCKLKCCVVILIEPIYANIISLFN